MKLIDFGKSSIKVPQIAVGCMGLAGLSQPEAERFIEFCLENGANFFDHADIYGSGECEKLFGKVLKSNPGLRDKIILQSKCGIVPGKMYDCSEEHILKAADASLKRLNTEQLDVLLLHRPDALMEPEEVASAFEKLHTSGKVKFFGVSNHKPSQIELIKKYCGLPVTANQLQLSITECNMIANGMEVNMSTPGAADRDGSVLDYCRLNGITVQAWSPYRYGFFEGIYLDNEKFPELNAKLKEIAELYGITPSGVVAAWILRHPAKIQMITGTMKTLRMKEIFNGAEINITREQWYEIYCSSGRILP